MRRIYKWFPTFFLTLVVFGSTIFPSYAQQCGGTSSSSCTSTQYNCGGSGNNKFCQQINAAEGGFACGAYEGSGSCLACVPNDQTCTELDCQTVQVCINSGGFSCLPGKPGCTCFNQLDCATGCTPGVNCDACNITYVGGGFVGCGSSNAKLCTSGCVKYCDSGTVNCQACTGGTLPTNECGDTTSNTSQTCQHNSPQTCTNQDFNQTGCTDFINNCSSNYSCPIGSGGPVNCQTSVNIHTFRDENHDGIQNGTDSNLGGVTMNYNSNVKLTDGSGNSSYGSLTSGTTVSVNGSVATPFNGTSYQNPSITKSVTLSNSNGNTTLSYGFIPTYTVSGHVYVDYNHNGTEDAEDVHYSGAGITVSLTGYGSTTTDASGNYSFTGVITGPYTLSISNVPTTYATSSPTSVGITVSADTTNNIFGVTPLYNISGAIYNDFDGGKCYNPSLITDPTFVNCTDETTTPSTIHGPGIDTHYTASSTTVTVTGTGVNQTLTQSNGTYDTGQVLESGTYTVSFTTLPTDYHMTYPVGGIPPSFSVTVGTPNKSIACAVGTYNDASCTVPGSINNLNFGMNNEIPVQIHPCTDVRDEVVTQDYIPSTYSCGTDTQLYAIHTNSACQQPGIYASGTVTPDFGHGSANVNNWLVGGATSESFTPVSAGVIRTSSSYILTTIKNNGLPTTDLSSVCTTSNCYLPSNLPDGIYTWPYNATIAGTHDVSSGTNTDGTYTFPTGKNYLFVVGDSSNSSSITFKSKILVPNGSTVTFVTSKDMYIDASVGESTMTSTNPDMEGFYSADNDFVVESAYASSDTRCTDTGGARDLRFNLIGSIVAGADGTGGTFTNQRDLCAGDLVCPVSSTGGGDNGTDNNLNLTYILNAPEVIKHKNTFWQELAP